MRTFVIAEAGSTHGRVLHKALDLVTVAKQAGADAVKFQFWSNPERLTSRRHLGTEAFQMYQRYQLPAHWLPILATDARRQGLEFMCTVYLPEDIGTVAPYVTRFKVASYEATDMQFIEAHPTDRHLIVSTGLMDEDAIRALPEQAVWRGHYLHCVSQYPASVDSIHLRWIRKYYLRGLSDHTGCVDMGGWAVIAGAEIVEVHFRLATTSPQNPDYPHSHSPHEVASYIAKIRMAERVQ